MIILDIISLTNKMRIKMTIKELEIFNKVVSCTNLTKLSKQINMSQPNISLNIQSIEQKLKEKLFDRIGKKLILNDKGKLLHQRIQLLFQEYEEIKNLFSDNKLEGNINIGSTKSLSIYFLPHLLYEYKKNS